MVLRYIRVFSTIVFVGFISLWMGAAVFGKDRLVPKDYPTIGAAVSEAEPGADRVVVTDKGVYKETVVVDKSLALISDPPGARIDSPTSSGLVLRRGASLVSVEGFVIANCAGDGIRVDPGDAKGTPGDPSLNASVDLRLSGTVVEHNKQNGVLFASGGPHKFRAGDKCVFRSNGTNGVHALRVADMKLKGCVIEKNGNHGFLVEPVFDPNHPELTTQVELDDCLLNSNGYHGVSLKRKVRFVASGCTINKSGKSGICLLDGVELTVRNSDLSENNEHGVRWSVDKNKRNSGNAPTRITMDGCTIRKSKSAGVRLRGGVDLLLSLNNTKIEENLDKGVRCDPRNIVKVQVALTQTSILNNKSDGFIVETGSAEITLSQTTISSNNGVGFKVEADSAEVTLSQTTISNNGKGGLQCKVEAETCVLTASDGCVFSENGDFGLALRGSARVNLKDCVLSENTRDGLVFKALEQECSVRVVLENCTMKGNERRGIFIQGYYDIDAAVKNCFLDGNIETGFFLYLFDNSHAEISFSGTSVSGNGKNGFLNQSRNVRFSADDGCAFNSNSMSGITSAFPIDLTLKRSQFHGNKDHGIQISEDTELLGLRTLPKMGSDREEDLSRIEMENCSIQSNGASGILLSGPMSSKMRVSGSEFTGSASGIHLKTPKNFHARLVLRDTTIHAGKEKAITIDESFIMFGGMKGLGVDAARRWDCLSETCTAIISNCKFGGNKERTSPFDVPVGNIMLLPSPLSDFEDADGFPLPPPSASAEKNTPPKAVSALGPASFTDIEKDFEKFDGASLLLEIGQRFSDHCGVENRSQLITLLLRHLRSHPDRALSCRLFQNLMGPSIAFLDSENIAPLVSIVKDFPDSALADAVLTELAMQGVYWPSSSNARENFLKNCDVAGETLAGIYLAALNDMQGSPEIDLARIRKAYHLIGEKYPEARKRSQPRLPRSAESSAEDRLLAYYLQCDITNHYLQLATSFRRLGAFDSAERFLLLARRAGLGFYPISTAGHYLPEQLKDVYQDSGESLSNETLATPDEIPSLSAMGLTPNTAETIEKRITDFRKAMYFSRHLRLPGEISSGSPTLESPGEEITRQFLEELTALLTGGMHPDVFVLYASVLENDMLYGFSAEEQEEILGRLENAVPFVLKSTRLKEEYLLCLARCYRSCENPAQEVEKLKLLTEISGDSEMKREALERLVELYLDYWNLPDQAIESLRKIVEITNDGEIESTTRLRIAKLFYGEGKYPQVVYELTQLLSKIPDDYKEEPIRVMLGLAYLGNQDYEDARNEFAKVINRDRGAQREKCLYLMGYAFISEQKYQEAVKPFTDYLNLYPDGANAKKVRDFLDKITKTGSGN